MSKPGILAAALVLSLAGPAAVSWQHALAQGAPKGGSLELDAGTESSGPDPLTPKEQDNVSLTAPGMPTKTAEPKADETVDAVVLAARTLLAQPVRGTAGEKDDQGALADFYASATKPIFVDAAGFTARAKLAMEEIRKADDWGLRASAFDLPAAVAADAKVEERAQAELKLATAVLTYARHARGGRLEPSAVSRLFDQRITVYDPKSLIRAVAVTEQLDAYLRNLHPQHAGFLNLQKALMAARHVKGEETAATPAVVIPAGPSIRPGQDHAHVGLIRTRLSVEAGAKETLYDEALVNAVKAFQKSRNLEATGIINAATRNALNEGGRSNESADNIRRIIVNMERWRWLPADLGEFYVWDSVPEQMTTVFEKGNIVLNERIVVGKINTPTMIFSADMQFVIFHPSWGVPPGMKAQELGPQLRQTSNGGWFFSSGPTASQVLAGHGLRVSRGGVPVDPDSVDWANANIGSYDFTQPPGPRNVLGMVKFRFPNKHDIYMHDTPERHLFGGAVRAFSHGCMRVQNPVKLAEVILAYDKGYDKEKVGEYARRGGEIKLEKRVPVHITYFTAVADDEGKVHYYADIYGLDGRVATALEGQNVRVASVASPGGGSVQSTASLQQSASSATQDETPEKPKRTQRARKKTKEAEPFNPFSALFGN